MDPDWLIQARKNGLIAGETKVNVGRYVGPNYAIEIATTPKLEEKPKAKKQPRLITDISEEKFQKQVIDLLHLHGWRVAHFRKVRIQRLDGSVYWQTPVAADGKGFLDLEAIRIKRLLKIELKVKTSLSDEQKAWIAAYEAAGIECYVWKPKDWETILQIVE